MKIYKNQKYKNLHVKYHFRVIHVNYHMFYWTLTSIIFTINKSLCNIKKLMYLFTIHLTQSSSLPNSVRNIYCYYSHSSENYWKWNLTERTENKKDRLVYHILFITTQTWHTCTEWPFVLLTTFSTSSILSTPSYVIHFLFLIFRNTVVFTNFSFKVKVHSMF